MTVALVLGLHVALVSQPFPLSERDRQRAFPASESEIVAGQLPPQPTSGIFEDRSGWRCVYPTECLGGPRVNAGVLTWGRFSKASWLCDRSSKIPLIGWGGGETVPLQSLTRMPETLSVCHVRIMEMAVIPENPSTSATVKGGRRQR